MWSAARVPVPSDGAGAADSRSHHGPSLLLDEGKNHGLAVLITGNYHARKDLGVPNYLIAQHPELEWSDILSLAFLEVVPGEMDPRAYLDQFSGRSAYDFIWFTPAVSNAITATLCDNRLAICVSLFRTASIRL